MATKYNLFIDETQVESATRAKKDAVVKIGDATGKSFEVRTDTGKVVHSFVAPETADEDLIGDSPVDPVPEPEKAVEEPEEVVFHETFDFPGNYSIVTAPGAVLIAEAVGVPVKSENVKGRLNRIVSFGGDDAAKAKAVRDLVEMTLTEAHAVLKDWQKANVESRKDLTDMQKFVQHREVLAKHFAKVAKQVKKDGIL